MNAYVVGTRNWTPVGDLCFQLSSCCMYRMVAACLTGSSFSATCMDHFFFTFPIIELASLLYMGPIFWGRYGKSACKFECS